MPSFPIVFARSRKLKSPGQLANASTRVVATTKRIDIQFVSAHQLFDVNAVQTVLKFSFFVFLGWCFLRGGSRECRFTYLQFYQHLRHRALFS